MLKIIATIIFIIFAVYISLNMLKFILSQKKHYNSEEEKIIRIVNKRRIRRVVILTILLPIVFFLMFLGNYLLKHN